MAKMVLSRGSSSKEEIDSTSPSWREIRLLFNGLQHMYAFLISSRIVCGKVSFSFTDYLSFFFFLGNILLRRNLHYPFLRLGELS